MKIHEILYDRIIAQFKAKKTCRQWETYEIIRQFYPYGLGICIDNELDV